jgi:hypothetical protein
MVLSLELSLLLISRINECIAHFKRVLTHSLLAIGMSNRFCVDVNNIVSSFTLVTAACITTCMNLTIIAAVPFVLISFIMMHSILILFWLILSRAMI